jgi:hypothetical protein
MCMIFEKHNTAFIFFIISFPNIALKREVVMKPFMGLKMVFQN